MPATSRKRRASWPPLVERAQRLALEIDDDVVVLHRPAPGRDDSRRGCASSAASTRAGSSSVERGASAWSRRVEEPLGERAAPAAAGRRGARGQRCRAGARRGRRARVAPQREIGRRRSARAAKSAAACSAGQSARCSSAVRAAELRRELEIERMRRAIGRRRLASARASVRRHQQRLVEIAREIVERLRPGIALVAHDRRTSRPSAVVASPSRDEVKCAEQRRRVGETRRLGEEARHLDLGMDAG